MKNKILIEGPCLLEGEVRISSSKNATVALIPAICLASEKVKIFDVPKINDVSSLCLLLESLNIKVSKEECESNNLVIDPSTIKNVTLDSDQVSKLRASYYFMGSLLGRFKYVKIKMPGGCNLGPRPIDLHLKGFKALGAKCEYKDGYYTLSAQELKGNTVYLDIPSVGATINIMMAAVYAKGVTTIENAAREPEIIDVASMLNSMGADIRGVGTDTINIYGSQSLLKGCMHEIMPDRIEAGTYIIMAATAAKKMTIRNIIPQHLDGLLSKLEEANVTIEKGADYVTISKASAVKPIQIKTMPYPGYATDLQSQMGSFLVLAEGESKITDTIYSERFKYCLELNKMGANIEIGKGNCLIKGPSKLKGTHVYATDLRCGAALIIAALVAEGVTTIDDSYHIYRGYENIIEKLKNLNVKVWEE